MITLSVINAPSPVQQHDEATACRRHVVDANAEGCPKVGRLLSVHHGRVTISGIPAGHSDVYIESMQTSGSCALHQAPNCTQSTQSATSDYKLPNLSRFQPADSTRVRYHDRRQTEANETIFRRLHIMQGSNPRQPADGQVISLLFEII